MSLPTFIQYAIQAGIYPGFTGPQGPIGPAGPPGSGLIALTATTGALNATYSNGTAGVGATLTDLSGTFAPFVNDGVTYSLNQTILVTDQGTISHNGYYTLTTNGDSSSVPWVLTRSVDYDVAGQMVAGGMFPVSSGATFASSIYVLLAPAPVTIGTDGIDFLSMYQLQQELAIAPSVLLGNPTGGDAAPVGITLGTNLSFAGNVLNASGGGGGVTALNIQEQDFVYAVDTGAANAYVITPTPALAAYVAGDSFEILIGNANSGASTLAVSGLSPTAITTTAIAALSSGMLGTLMVARVTFDGTQFQVLNPISAGGGSSPWTAGSGTTSAYGGGATDGGANNTLAWGVSAYASGNSSVVLGQNCHTTASNAYAFGFYALTQNNGSYVFLDAGSAYVTSVYDHAPNQMVQGFGGGYYLYGTAAYTLGWSMDAANNIINHAGISDQSNSYQVPTTGFSIAIAPGVASLTLAPAGTIATGTIDLGSVTPVDQQLIEVETSATITALSFIGATVNNAPTTLAAGQGFKIRYNLANAAYDVVYQPSAGGGGSSPWTAGSGATSAYGGGATDGGSDNTLAWGAGSVAVGTESVAIGWGAVTGATSAYAFGRGANAQAQYSYAFGDGATAGWDGSFVFVDSVASNTKQDSAANQMVQAFRGGYYLYGKTSYALGWSMDTHNNEINHAGVADQSNSYQVPTTGFSITPAAGVASLTLAPTGTIATGTIVMSSLAPIDGQLFEVEATNTITALSFSGATVNNPPTTLGAGQGCRFRYNLANTAWNVVYQATPYLEGTWTPVVTSSGGGTCSYSSQSGSYTKIGNIVFFNAYILLSDVSSLTAGNITVAGLPIAAADNFSCSTFLNNAGVTATTAISGVVLSSSTEITPYVYSAGTETMLTASQLTNTSTLILTGQYHI